MRRLLPTLAVTLLVAAACSDQSTLPTSSLSPSKASYDKGLPPPPPVAGDGLADFAAFLEDGSENVCSTNDSFGFSYDYLVNKPANNAFLHMRIDGRGLDVAIHQTNKKVDAKGTLNGPGYSFEITETKGGAIVDEESHVPVVVTLQLVGKLTTEGGTCTTNAILTARLSPSRD